MKLTLWNIWVYLDRYLQLGRRWVTPVYCCICEEYFKNTVAYEQHMAPYTTPTGLETRKCLSASDMLAHGMRVVNFQWERSGDWWGW